MSERPAPYAFLLSDLRCVSLEPVPHTTRCSRRGETQAVSESTKPGSLADFGPNEWLVDEMFDQYQDDPSSVSDEWRTLFAERDGSSGATASTVPATNGQADTPAPSAPTAAAAPAESAPATTPVTRATPKKSAPAGATAPDSPPRSGSVAAGAAAKAATSPPSTEKPVPGPPSPAPRELQRKDAPKPDPTEPTAEPEHTILRGAAARTVTNMAVSLTVPTATSVRSLPVKLLVDNRIVINNHLSRARGGKVSFTHVIGFAIVQALKTMPEMNYSFQEIDGKPNLVKPVHINLGLAIDLQKPDGSRQLLVPGIKDAEGMGFAEFWTAYEDVVRRARDNKLIVADFHDISVSLTNPGTLGTNHSVPRLMSGQGAIIGVGAMEYPPEWQGAAEETLARNAVSKVMTLTSTYDHRVIQGAQSGDFLRRIHALLLGDDGFYDTIFRALRIPYEPIRWAPDISANHEDEISKQARILELIHAYRVRGHIMADTDPLEYQQRSHPDLDIGSHGLTLWDLDREFASGSFGVQRFTKLRDILGVLRDSYCRTTGIEYMHIQDPEQRRWIQERVERPHSKTPRGEQLRILHKLNQAEAFETFLQTKFVGQKRFSLEGAETTAPLIDEICDAAADDGLDEVTIGMAHRGRLNVLANIVGKSYSQIFREFEGNIDPTTVQGSGDVKYHLGAEGEFTSGNGNRIRVSVAANPSHLEAADPVLEGIARAKQDLLKKGDAYPVLPLLVHGDAAFAGQGVVAETLNLSQLRGYRTGGTVHVVVNNQVGFTTSPSSSRSSLYCTDVARMVQAPIFHVNGDDPEACIRVAQLAFEYRQAFNKDVVIDLVCYRRRGHNEGDDPSYTQPLMYDLIERKRSVRRLYTEALIGRGDITIEEAESAMRDYQRQLEAVFTEVRAAKNQTDEYLTVPEYPTKGAAKGSTDTAITADTMKLIADAHVSPPEGFTVHPKVLPQLQRRAAAIANGPIDWGTGEILAFGSLLMQGRPVRLSGQDSRRGTFVTRFATLIDRVTAEEWTPLANLTKDQASFSCYDSLLSEFAAMGFEYGYSVARPEVLTLWEAQFGDFANGAQTIIDEFIVAGEAKWQQQSGVVLLLPHGYDGQGPDHSSARIERFLTLAADDAFTVAQPSTSASYFHLLRRHSLRFAHRPMVVFTPKSMLKRKEAASAPVDFTTGTLETVVGDADADRDTVSVLMLCSGRITWDLMAERVKRDSDGRVAIARLEQLYPNPIEEMRAEIAKYPNLREIRWVQDEPANMGPWPYLALNLAPELDLSVPFHGVSRPASSSPSCGQKAQHVQEQADLFERAFA
ncbi:MAG: multifunctional oxoglutarate decarboxylase/oxoglutarate dehydrogenase thiamine pyrophosphate-binding subunit/dihydrolipoyllysine-residue succinyltransferase subunit [Nocardioidaceae bacterium]